MIVVLRPAAIDEPNARRRPRKPEQPVASTSKRLEPAWTHAPPDAVNSSAWYPGASAYDPAMFAFATGVKDHPVHLLDGHDWRVSAPTVSHLKA